MKKGYFTISYFIMINSKYLYKARICPKKHRPKEV